MEDIRVMRKTYTSQRTISLSGGGGAIVVADRAPLRVALIISAEVLQWFTINQIPSAISNIGIPCPANNSIKFDIQRYGDLVIGTWYAGNGAEGSITVTETFLEAE